MSTRRSREPVLRPLHHPLEGDGADPSSVRLFADLHGDDERFVIEVDLPGVRTDELQVYALGDAIVVEGNKEERRPPRAERPAYERAERDYGPFRRSFALPGPADLSRSVASLRSGVLTISVPRIVDRRGRQRRIRVNVET
jgi:HSP20 family protein